MVGDWGRGWKRDRWGRRMVCGSERETGRGEREIDRVRREWGGGSRGLMGGGGKKDWQGGRKAAGSRRETGGARRRLVRARGSW
jgi:hypothetical protein